MCVCILDNLKISLNFLPYWRQLSEEILRQRLRIFFVQFAFAYMYNFLRHTFIICFAESLLSENEQLLFNPSFTIICKVYLIFSLRILFQAIIFGN